MKMKLAACVAMALIPVSGWAGFKANPIAGPREGRSISLAGEFSLGVVNGKAKEHVYDYENPDGSRRQLSRLDWDIDGVAMGGFNGSARVTDRLTLNGGLWLALSKGSGQMEDYDWMLVGRSEWTHYSLSDVDVERGYVFDVNVAYDVFRSDALRASVAVGYKQDGWEWEDSGIFLLYPEYGYVPVFLYGENMINYEQEFRMPYLGASVEWSAFSIPAGALSGDVVFSGYGVYSPYLWATDWDEHVARDLHFKETFEGGDMLGFGLGLRYELPQGSFKNAFVAAALDYQKIGLMVGDMEVRNVVTGETGGGKDVAGAENKYVAFSLGAGLRF